MGTAFQVRALKAASRLVGRPERLRDMLGAPPGAEMESAAH